MRKTKLLQMHNVGIVVDDLKAAIAFFAELGLELEGETTVEGQWVDRIVGLNGVRSDIAMMRTPDGHSRLELTKLQRPTATSVELNAPVNTLGIRRIMIYDQQEFDIRCEWGAHGVAVLAPISDVIIIIDVLRFSTSVDVAVTQGAVVFPYRWRDDTAL